MIPEPITRYRNWVFASSIGVRLLLLVGVVGLFLVAGSSAGVANATLPALVVRLIYWSILLFILYTLYAIVWSFVPGYNALDDRDELEAPE